MDEDEDIEVKMFELRDAREMVRRGEIRDMKTLVGLAFDLIRYFGANATSSASSRAPTAITTYCRPFFAR